MNSGSGYSLRGVQGRVIEGLGRAIVRGRYGPGDLLPREQELIEEYGVSRTSLREAMKVLAAKGLLEIRQKSGTRVRPEATWNAFDSDLFAWSIQEGKGEVSIRDLIELRQLLEPSAARLAASRATMVDVKRLDEAHSAMAATVNDPQHYAENDVAFHVAVFAASHNVFLQRFGNLVADFLRLSFDMQQKAMLERSQIQDFTEDAAHHRAVFNGINRGEPEVAASAMLDLILDGKRNLFAAIGAVK